MGLAIFAIVVAIVSRRMQGRRIRAPRPHLVDILTLATVAGYALYAAAAAPWEIDFWAIWGLKARIFLEAGGIDWHFLESRWNVFQHSDYPLLVPLNLDFAALVAGQWDDRWMGAFFVAWGASLVAVVRSLAAREATPFYASLITFAVAACRSLSHFVGLGGGAPGRVRPRRRCSSCDAHCATTTRAAWRQGALFLGLAANCKNEGLALLAGRDDCPGRPLRCRRTASFRESSGCGPHSCLPHPWMLALRAVHGTLPTDLATGDASRASSEAGGAPGRYAGIDLACCSRRALCNPGRGSCARPGRSCRHPGRSNACARALHPRGDGDPAHLLRGGLLHDTFRRDVARVGIVAAPDRTAGSAGDLLGAGDARSAARRLSAGTAPGPTKSRSAARSMSAGTRG